MMCRKAVQSKRRNYIFRKVQYLGRFSGCAKSAQKGNQCVCELLNCSQSHCNSIQSVTDTKQCFWKPPHPVTLREIEMCLVISIYTIHGSEKKSTIQGTAFLHNIWIPPGKEWDNIESSSFFPLSTVPIKLLHFLSLTNFPSNSASLNLTIERGNWKVTF